MSNVTVQGSDGQKPNYDPNALFRIWDKGVLFMGPTDVALGKWVPKIFDYAIDLTINKWYQVIDVDQVTLTPTFRALDDEETAGLETILVGTGDQPKTMIAHFDTNQLPYSLSLDSRHYINGSENTYARVFRGSDVSPEKLLPLQSWHSAPGSFCLCPGCSDPNIWRLTQGLWSVTLPTWHELV